SSVPSSSSSSSVESSNVSSTSSVSSSSSSEQTSKVSSEQSSSSSSEISSVPSVATSTSSSSSTSSEKVIPVETSSSSSKKELVINIGNSSVKIDKKKDLPQTGEKHNEVLWLSIIGCIVLAGSLWIFERKYKDRKSTRLNSSHVSISYAVFCLKKKIDAHQGEVERLPAAGADL